MNYISPKIAAVIKPLRGITSVVSPLHLFSKKVLNEAYSGGTSVLALIVYCLSVKEK